MPALEVREKALYEYYKMFDKALNSFLNTHGVRV
jgi:hypothetical protein